MARQKPRMKPKEPIPPFASREEEAAFWDEHDLSNYWDDFERVDAKSTSDPKGSVSVRSA
jgi:hypothetical protein